MAEDYNVSYSPVERRMRVELPNGNAIFLDNVRVRGQGDQAEVYIGDSRMPYSREEARDYARMYAQRQVEAYNYSRANQEARGGRFYPNIFQEPTSTFSEGLPRLFGFLPEVQGLSARVSNAFGNRAPSGQRYDPDLVEHYADVNLQDEREARPVTSFGADMLAGLPLMALSPTAATTTAAARGAAPLSRAALGPAVRQGATEGAAWGALAGFGEAPTGQRGTGALTGATIGAGLGASAPVGADAFGRYIGGPTFRAVQSGVRRMSGQRGASSADRAAIDRYVGALMNDGRTRDEALAEITAFASAPNDVAFYEFFENAPTLQQVVRSAARGSGRSTQPLVQTLDDRMSAQAASIVDETRSALGLPQGALDRRTALIEARKETADQMYDAALYQGPSGQRGPRYAESTESVRGLLWRLPEEVVNRANRSIRMSGRGSTLRRSRPRSGGAEMPADRSQPTRLDDLHSLYQSIGDTVAAHRKGDTSLNRTEVRQLLELQQELLDIMPQEYRAAVDTFAGDSRMVEALDLGRNFFRESPDDFAQRVAAMTPSELEQARVGFLQAVEDSVTKRRDNLDATVSVMSSPQQRQMARTLFDSDEQFNEFMQTFTSSRERFSAARNVDPRRGPPPDAAQAVDAANEQVRTSLVGALASAFAGRPKIAIDRFVNTVGRYVGRISGAESEGARNRAVTELATMRPPDFEQAAQLAFDQYVLAEVGQGVLDAVRQAAVPGIPAGYSVYFGGGTQESRSLEGVRQ